MADDRQLLAATWKVRQDSQIPCQQYSKPVELTCKQKLITACILVRLESAVDFSSL